ncbi:heavy metal transporter [Yinghuangia aomiensis]|uniref:Heavy metal transporter n=1 Tax=Yinghuangia aomiensis TaxID=676205 RepID=A0ABP9H8J3_9ACTN
MGQRKRAEERNERSGIVGWVIALLVVLGLFAAVAVVVVKMLPGGGTPSDECTVPDASGASDTLSFDPEQAANAATIAAVGQARGLPDRAIEIALATSMQESKLFNISYGDADSLGLFQQRPSMGWGTQAQLQDPVYASGKFYDALVKVPNYTDLPLTQAAQKVQRSAYPDAYARHENKAVSLTAALTGRAPATLSCRLAAKPGVVTAAPLRTALTKDFKPAVADSAVADATGTLAVQPGKTDGRGWAIASWAVAHAQQLGIREVSYGGKVWTREDGGDGWQTVKSGSGKAAPADATQVQIRYTDAPS